MLLRASETQTNDDTFLTSPCDAPLGPQTPTENRRITDPKSYLSSPSNIVNVSRSQVISEGVCDSTYHFVHTDNFPISSQAIAQQTKSDNIDF